MFTLFLRWKQHHAIPFRARRFGADFAANWQSLEANYDGLGVNCKILVIPSHVRHSELSHDNRLLKVKRR